MPLLRRAGNEWELETRGIVKAQKTYECRRLETEDRRLRLGLCRGVGADVSGSPMLPFFPTSRKKPVILRSVPSA